MDMKTKKHFLIAAAVVMPIVTGVAIHVGAAYLQSKMDSEDNPPSKKDDNGGPDKPGP